MGQPHVDRRLWEAIALGDADAVAKALTEGGDPNRQQGAWTPLGKALREGAHEEIALLLLDAGAKPDKADGDRSSPLTQAVRAGWERVVGRLLTSGQAPGGNHLMMASRTGRTTLFLLLWEPWIRAGNLPYVRKDSNERTQSFLGAWKPHQQPPQELIDATLAVPCHDVLWLALLEEAVKLRSLSLAGILLAEEKRQQRWGPVLMARAVRTSWEPGMSLVTECCPNVASDEVYDPERPSVMASAIEVLRQAKPAKAAWDQVEALVAQGFSLHHPCGLMRWREGRHAILPVPLVLMAARHPMGIPLYTKKLLALFDAQGVDVTTRWPENDIELGLRGWNSAHFFLDSGRAALAGGLAKLFPGRRWESSEHPLLFTAIACRAKEAHHPSLVDVALDLGADVHARDPKGRSVMAALAQGTLPGNYPQIIAMLDRLLAAGASAEDALEQTREFEAHPALAAKWQQRAMRAAMMNDGAAPQVARRRL